VIPQERDYKGALVNAYVKKVILTMTAVSKLPK